MVSVSAIIPTYNRSETLPRALESILEQTYNDIEVIVIDDCSTDNTSSVVKSYEDDRITYIRHNKNKGANAARNTGIKASSGEFIAFLDDDDMWLKEKIELQIRKFESLPPSYGIIYSGRQIIKDGKIIEEYIPEYSGWIYTELLKKNYIPSESPLIRRECFNQAGLFDTRLQSSQDRDMWLRIAKDYRIGFVPKILAVTFWDRDDRISQDYSKKYQGSVMLFKKYWRDVLKHPESVYYMTSRVSFYFIMNVLTFRSE